MSLFQVGTIVLVKEPYLTSADWKGKITHISAYPGRYLHGAPWYRVESVTEPTQTFGNFMASALVYLPINDAAVMKAIRGENI